MEFRRRGLIGLGLAAALDQAQRDFIASLDRHTLADLVPRARSREIIALVARRP